MFGLLSFALFQISGFFLFGFGQFCFALLSLFAGLYSVPMYALIQMRSQPTHRARIIAANNILNALFMVAAAVVSILFLSVAKLSIPQLFLVVSLLNIAVNTYIFRIVPEFTMRFMIWLLSHSMYRVQHRDLERIPDEGAAATPAFVPQAGTQAVPRQVIQTARTVVTLGQRGRATTLYTDDVIVMQMVPTAAGLVPGAVTEQIVIRDTDKKGAYANVTGHLTVLGNSIDQNAPVVGQICSR